MNHSFKSNRVLQALVAWLLVCWSIAAIDPHDRHDWFLENLLVFFSCAVLLVSYRWFQFSNLSYGLFVAFLSLHTLGAHYTYSETPVGFWLQDWFGWQRNHYDRIVHFNFGLLIAYPLRELLLRASQIKPSWSYVMAIMVIMAFSDLYEVIEGAAALIVDPELGVAFVGAQGDVWDAQKDTFLAFVGSITAMVICWLWNRFRFIKNKIP